jgi:hypothetical protein
MSLSTFCFFFLCAWTKDTCAIVVDGDRVLWVGSVLISYEDLVVKLVINVNALYKSVYNERQSTQMVAVGDHAVGGNIDTSVSPPIEGCAI